MSVFINHLFFFFLMKKHDRMYQSPFVCLNSCLQWQPILGDCWHSSLRFIWCLRSLLLFNFLAMAMSCTPVNDCYKLCLLTGFQILFIFPSNLIYVRWRVIVPFLSFFSHIVRKGLQQTMPLTGIPDIIYFSFKSNLC